MPLTPEEEKKFRDEIRKELEERDRRDRVSKDQEQVDRSQHLESRLRRQIAEEEEEKYFTDRGFVRYLNRHGGVEWLTPDEAENRRSRRRTRKKTPSRRKAHRNKKFVQWIINGVMVVFALAVFMYLLRYNPNAGGNSAGNVVVKTDVPGAQIFVNGTEKPDFFTPDTLSNLSAGAHFVAVHKEGYSAWPPMQRVNLEKNKTLVLEFTLKSAAVMGNVLINSNESDFDIYVDGIPVPEKPGQEFQVPAGYHIFSAIKKGYLAEPQHQRVLVKAGEMNSLFFHFQARDDIGYLQVTSNRNSGYIFVDNQLTGIKPNGRPIPVRAGIYEIRLCENGYASIPQTELIRLAPGEVRALSFSVKEEPQGDTLRINTTTPGAGIMIDGQWQALVTPVNDIVLSKGDHYLNFMRDGQLYAQKEIHLVPGRLDDNELVYDF